MSLSSLIVQREIATIRQVEEALARQVLYGGDLVTNLLEVAKLDEATLTVLLAESFGMAAATLGPLPTPSERARGLIGEEMATGRAMVALAVEGASLIVAVAEPLPKEVEDELTFALGLHLVQRIAPMVRIRESLSRLYGVPLERRLQRLLHRLAGGAPTPSMEPGAERRSGAPPSERRSVSPSARMPFQPSLTPAVTNVVLPPVGRVPTNAGFPAVAPPAVTPPAVAPAAPGPQASAETTEHRRTLLQRDLGATRPARRRRGPIVVDQARKELDEVEGRDAILDLFFDYARQYFDYSVIFVVHSDIAEGREAYGDGASRERVQAIGVPLDLPSVLAAARDACAAVKVEPNVDGLDPVLLGDLQRKTRGEVLVVPIVVRTRCVALFYGDSGDDGVDQNAARDVAGFGLLVGQRFEKMIVRKKLAGFVPGPATTPHSNPSSLPTTPNSQAAPPLQLYTVPIPREAPGARPATSLEETPAYDPSYAQAYALESPSADAFPTNTVPIPPPDMAPASSDLRVPASQALPSLDDILAPSIDELLSPQPFDPFPEPRLTPMGAPVSSTSPVPSVPISSGPVSPGSVDRPPPASSFAVRRPSGPPIPREEPIDARWGSHATPAPAPLPPASTPPLNVPLESLAPLSDSAPPSASFAVAPHRPPTSRIDSKSALPSVIVDVDETASALVDRVMTHGSDEAAEAELIRQGSRAMPAIMSRFPGPTVVDRARVEDGSLRVADCGPVLRLIAGQRRVSLPFVLPIVGDGDAGRRYWATFLLTELPYAEAVDALVPRLFDPDSSVRKVARLAARAVAEVASEALMDRLVRFYRDPALSHERRIEMIETLGELRERLAVPLLIDALNDELEEVAAAGRRALMIVTRQDLGRDARKWQAWWAQNATRHRVEWLMDALMHEVPAIRRAAGDELKAITKEYFGYYDDLPRKEREKAQQRYRDWWGAEGRLRFQRR